MIERKKKQSEKKDECTDGNHFKDKRSKKMETFFPEKYIKNKLNRE